MNMIRVWGGGFYEHDDFYDALRRARPARLAGLHVRLLAIPVDAGIPRERRRRDALPGASASPRTPSIALWCGDNEIIGSLNWYEESRKNRDRYLVNYDRLNRAIEHAIVERDPDRRLWPSSPCPGALDYRRRLARRHLGRHALLVGLARGQGLRALLHGEAALLLRVRLPVLPDHADDRALRRAVAV